MQYTVNSSIDIDKYINNSQKRDIFYWNKILNSFLKNKLFLKI